MENHHFSWVNPLFLWPFSIAFCMFTRGLILPWLGCLSWPPQVVGQWDGCGNGWIPHYYYLQKSKMPSRALPHMGMDQYLLIPFLVGWTSIYQLFWCSPGVQGFDTLPYHCWLVVTGTMEFYDYPFSWEWNVITPTDELTPSFFRGVGQPPTTYHWVNVHIQIPHWSKIPRDLWWSPGAVSKPWLWHGGCIWPLAIWHFTLKNHHFCM